VDLGVNLLSVLEFFLPTLFGFWPILIITPFTLKRYSLKQALVIWGILVIVRISLVFLPGEGLTLIPDPLNIILFISAGFLLIGIVLIKRRRQEGIINVGQILINSVEDFYNLDSADFEMVIAQILRERGNQVRLMGGQGDHGVDLMVRTKRGENLIVQCKNWKGTVGEPAVRDLYGVLHHLNADRAVFISSGGFTDQAVKWAEGKPINLITGEKLIEIWRSTKKSNMD
jgi:HJR/Mrr/RecB family endonuclease